MFSKKINPKFTLQNSTTQSLRYKSYIIKCIFQLKTMEKYLFKSFGYLTNWVIAEFLDYFS